MRFLSSSLLPLAAVCVGLGLVPAQAQGPAKAPPAATKPLTFNSSKTFDELTHAEKTIAKKIARSTKIHNLRVCADPGNMPMSSFDRQGFQNKIIDVLAKAMDVRVSYFWRPYLERGLTRDTFANAECDVLLDMPTDYQGLLTTLPIYRTAYVLAYRDDSGLDIKDLDDEALKTLRIGVFQHSAMRLALAKRGIRNNVELHIISHDADLSPEKQPWRQVQKVVDGDLDVAAVWGPFAGYVKSKGEPIVVKPVNLMEDQIPLEFSLSIAMQPTEAVLKFRLDDALEASKDEIEKILKEYDVPLVQCSQCIVGGDLPSHGTFFERGLQASREVFLEPLKEEHVQLNTEEASEDQIVTAERVEQWLADGSDLDLELSNAVLASDQGRVELLLDRGADISKLNKQGLAPIHGATRQRDSKMLSFLLERGAKVDTRDSDGWTPLAHAVYRNHVPSIEVLAEAGADLEDGSPGFTPLSIALSEGKFYAAKALLDIGASANKPAGEEGLTPLMLVASLRQVDKRADRISQGPSVVEIAQVLIGKGADVNARSTQGVTPLMVAAAYDNPPLIGMLLQSGADIDAKTPDGKTAFEIAAFNKNIAALQQLRLHKRLNADKRSEPRVTQ